MLNAETLAFANAAPRYRITPLYDEHGQVSEHYCTFLRQVGITFEEAMASVPHFSGLIGIDLEAEKIAHESLAGLAEWAPDQQTRELYLQWLGFVNVDLLPWTTGGAIHFRGHWARVLMLALALGHALDLPECDLNALAMAAVLHDSRRADPYLDTGHGARAAAYYAELALADDDQRASRQTHAGRSLTFDPRTYLAMSWHDRDDADGNAAIEACMDNDALPELGIDKVHELIPIDAKASAELIYHLFKDADALDRVRLGPGGLDPKFLRTDPARTMIPYAEQLLAATKHPTPSA